MKVGSWTPHAGSNLDVASSYILGLVLLLDKAFAAGCEIPQYPPQYVFSDSRFEDIAQEIHHTGS